MLNCSACILQCIRTLCGRVVDNSSSLPSLKFPLRPQSLRLARSRSWLVRSYASVATTVPPATSLDLPMRAHYSKHKQRAIAESEVFSKTSLEHEMRYLRDPLKLADHTRSLLQKNEHKKAYELVKMGSKGDAACTVAWNHLIDYEMSEGKVANAVKLFNDMKKRAQKPDAHTFTILLRGLSWHPEYPQTLARALSIYQSMHADNSAVKPSIIHTNALLQVCARCKDKDALFGVAAKIPTHGAGAANNLTFTTILNALRTDAWTSLDDDTPDSKDERRQRATMEGRRIWGEVIGRWQKGDLRMDEELVCSMGRLLLLGGSTNDCEDILSLVEQTMGIQRPTPRPDKPSHQAVLNAPTDVEVVSDGEFEASSSNEFPSESATEIPGSEFHPVANPRSKKTPYATPGRNTISMVLDACIRLRAIPSGQEYWNLLTDCAGPYNVTPDAENLHMYLRLLRVQRASKLALELISGIRDGRSGLAHIALEAKTFRVALSTCVRDSMNPNVLDIAGKLVRMMMDTLEVPDVKSLEMYLQVAMSCNGRDWRSLMGVLRGSVLGIRNLRSYLSYEAPPESSFLMAKTKKGELKVSREEVVGLATKMIGAFDVTINTGAEAMSSQDRAECMEQRNILGRWVTRIHNMGQMKKRYKNTTQHSEAEPKPQRRTYMGTAQSPSRGRSAPPTTEGGMRKRMQRIDKWRGETQEW